MAEDIEEGLNFYGHSDEELQAFYDTFEKNYAIYQ